MELLEFQRALGQALTSFPLQKGTSQELLDIVHSSRMEPLQALEIYQNNMHQNLRGALEISFPLSCILLGEECFRKLALAYVRAFPCRSSDLNAYGEDLPRFAASQPGLDDLAYLKDFMQLELYQQAVYYAPEDDLRRHYKGIEDYFQELIKQPPASARLYLSSTVRLLDSQHPLLQLWKLCWQAKNNQENETKADQEEKILEPTQEQIIIYRQNEEVFLERAEPRLWSLLLAIQKGASLARLGKGVFSRNSQAEILQGLSSLFLRGWLGVGSNCP